MPFKACTVIASGLLLLALPTAAHGADEPAPTSLSNSSPPEESPEQFVERLLVETETTGYQPARLKVIINEYNCRQDKQFGIYSESLAGNSSIGFDQSEEPEDLNKGHSRFEFDEISDEHFVLKLTAVEESHTSRFGIDGGRDTHATIFFSKAPVAEITTLAGPTYSFPKPNLQLSIPATDSCLGQVPEGKLSVYDIKRNKEYFNGKLPKDTIAFTLLPPDQSSPNAMSFSTMSETIIGDDASNRCEIGSWATVIKEVFELNCNQKSQKCSMTRKSRKVSQRCQSIGACD